MTRVNPTTTRLNRGSIRVNILANNAPRAHHASAHSGVSTNGLSDICLIVLIVYIEFGENNTRINDLGVFQNYLLTERMVDAQKKININDEDIVRRRIEKHSR